MRTTVDIEKGTLRRAKALAATRGDTLGSVVSEALIAYFVAEERAAARAAPRLPVARHSSLRSGIDLSPRTLKAILEEDETEARTVPR